MQDEAKPATTTAMEDLKCAPLWRRAMAAIYDALLLFSVLLIAAIPPLFFTGGQAVPAGNFIFETYLFLICFAYYGLLGRAAERPWAPKAGACK